MSLNIINHNVVNPERLVDNIPSKSGLYGWFYNYSYIKGFSNNPDKIKSMLLDTSQKLKNPEFITVLSAKFGNQFKGELSYVGKFNEGIIDEKINSLGQSDIELLFDILQDFSQPLYIGIAKNLRERYSQHYKSISENLCDLDKAKGQCFGHRIQKQEIHIEELVYKYKELHMERDKIENIEYIANRFFKPIFGRR